MDYRRIDELNIEAEQYVMELMTRFEEEMQGERKNYLNAPVMLEEEIPDGNLQEQEAV